MNKTRKSKRGKWNFSQLYAEFIDSDYQDVKTFFEGTYGAFNSHLSKHTTGWGQKKRERDQRIVERVLKQKEGKEAMMMARALNNIRYYFQDKVKDKQQLQRVGVKDAVRIWEVLMTENGLPTKITKNTNVNFDETQTAKAFDELDSYANNDQSQTASKVQDPGQGEGGSDLQQ